MIITIELRHRQVIPAWNFESHPPSAMMNGDGVVEVPLERLSGHFADVGRGKFFENLRASVIFRAKGIDGCMARDFRDHGLRRGAALIERR